MPCDATISVFYTVFEITSGGKALLTYYRTVHKYGHDITGIKALGSHIEVNFYGSLGSVNTLFSKITERRKMKPKIKGDSVLCPLFRVSIKYTKII